LSQTDPLVAAVTRASVGAIIAKPRPSLNLKPREQAPRIEHEPVEVPEDIAVPVDPEPVEASG
jgi:hypothetical protein